MSNKKHYGVSGLKIIGIHGVVKRLGKENITAVDDLNLEVNHGQILTILGPSGCGKTTTLRLIAGFESPDFGVILINGIPVAGSGAFVSPEKRNVGIVLQEFALFPHLNVRRNIAFGLMGMNQKEVDERVRDMIDLTGLQDLEERYPYQLSGGQQQRVALARALAPSPLIVLLDEPFASIDPDLRSRVRLDLKRILKEAGVTAIFVTHDQEEAFLIADKIAVMNKGKIHQIGTPMEIYHNPHDRFVAEFVGHADFIPGKANSTKIVTEIGEFALNSNNVTSGEDVTVMLRSSDIDVIPTEFGIGTIESVEFKGHEVLYSIKLKSGQIIHSSQHSSYIPVVGTPVNIIVNPNHLTVFKGDGISTKNEMPVTL
jgi:iron(III) transport system ATP-binding protein